MKSLIKNGFTRREDLDFSDDGARFQAYEYNGLIITKTTYKGEYFISIRVDYVKGINYYDYKNKYWYGLADEFNGVNEVDVDRLKDIMDEIAEGIDDLKEEIAKEKIDWTEFDRRATIEAASLQVFIDKNKMVDITKLDSYDLRKMQHALTNLKNTISNIEQKVNSHDRYAYKFFEENKYVCVQDLQNDYWIKEAQEVINKMEAK